MTEQKHSALTGLSILGQSQSEAGQGAQTFAAVDPNSGQSLSPAYQEVSEQEIEKAVALAHAAAPVFARTPAKQRAQFLRAVADGLDSAIPQLVERMPAETGLPEGRVRGETGRTCGQLRMFADLIEEGSWVDARIDHAQPDRQPIPKVDLRSMLRAIGPVVVFGASNFPMAYSVAGGDTASAWAAGCPVIVKAHPSHPGVSEIVGRVIQKAVAQCELPEGVFSLLYSAGIELGLRLVKHPQVKAVGFTGSLRGGRALFDAAASRPEPIPVFAEMGSINPIVILPEALNQKGEEIAGGLAGSVTLGVGQFCTNPGLVILPTGEQGDRFAQSLQSKMKEASAGTMLHAGIAKSYSAGTKGLAKFSSVESLLLSENEDGSCQGSPALFQTDGQSFVNHAALREEVFGPSTLLVRVKDRSEMVEVLKVVPGQLTATLHGSEEELKSADDLLIALEEICGRLIVGQFPTGVEVCPSMVHGGPYPATTDARSTSVGTAAITRFARPVCFQNFPSALLPDELKDENPVGITRIVDGKRT